MTTKANEDASIRASGWTVAVTDANFTGTSAATANAAATQVVAIKYTLKKGAEGTPSSEITSTAKITLPAGAIGMSDVKTLLDTLNVTDVVVDTAAADVKTKVDAAITALVGAEVKKYYTIEAETPGSAMGSIAGTSKLEVTINITPLDGGSADTVPTEITAVSA